MAAVPKLDPGEVALILLQQGPGLLEEIKADVLKIQTKTVVRKADIAALVGAILVKIGTIVDSLEDEAKD